MMYLLPLRAIPAPTGRPRRLLRARTDRPQRSGGWAKPIAGALRRGRTEAGVAAASRRGAIKGTANKMAPA
ncbi:hypothetical protein [Sphingopyxis macrogoltabida]|nr:hypothetical protein [Sphingopyxis macrogoltabida]